MKLFPKALYRIAGGAFDNFHELNMIDSICEIEKIKAHKTEIEELKDDLCGDLYSQIKEIKDGAIQKKLLNLKRDIFNSRKLSSEKINLVVPYLDTKTSDKFLKYNSLHLRIENALKNGAALFEKELLSKRKLLIDLSSEENFLKGLMLSSQPLYEGLHKYIAKKGIGLIKKDYQVELSIIKYLSRMYCKTSPYSTFTSLAIGPITNQNNSNKIINTELPNENPLVTKSHVRLNNFLLRHIRTLLLYNKLITKNWKIRINPTTKVENSDYLFLNNIDNVESFQRIPINPVVSLLYEIIQEKKELSYEELKQLIIEGEYLDAGESEIEGLIDQLLGFGFLEFIFEVSGLDPYWDIKLIHQIETQSDIHHISQLIQALKKLRRAADGFANANVLSRPIILQSAHEEIKQVCLGLRNFLEDSLGYNKEFLKSIKSNLIDFIITPELLFCEDSSMNISPSIKEIELNELVGSLDKLMQEMVFFEKVGEKNKMLEYFTSKYKTFEVDLLTFYEDYYKEVKMPEFERIKTIEDAKKESDLSKREILTQKNRISEIENNEIKKRKELLKQWADAFDHHVREQIVFSDSTCFISLAQIKTVNNSISVKHHSTSTHSSYSAFIQPFEYQTSSGKNKLSCVVNGVFPGWGKMCSRFLHLFDNNTSEEFKKWNSDSSEDYIFMENSDASFFNANIHPPLMPYEILTPNGSNNLAKEKLLPVMDFVVKVDTENEELYLIHKPTGKRSYLFDLSFENTNRRSQLFQLLNNFSLLKNTSFRPLIDIINERYFEKSDVTIYPRIVIESDLILQRKSWVIEKKEFPSKEPSDTDWDYFLKMNVWKEVIKIPNDVFVYIDPSSEPITNSKLTRDDYKPQYINFKNPFLIVLLEKLIQKSSYHLRIVEMMPNAEQLNKIGKNKHVIESVIEWSV